MYAHDAKYIYAWFIPGGNEHHRIAIDAAERGSCRFLRDGERILLIGSKDETEEGIHHLAVRDLRTNTLHSAVDVHVETYGLLTILLNRAEDTLLLRDCGDMWHFLQFPSCRRLRSLKAESYRGIVYSPDEAEIWTTSGEDEPGGYRDYLCAWDPLSGKLLRRRRLQDEQFYYGLALTPDALWLLVVGEKTLAVLDPGSWELLKVFRVPTKWEMCQPVLAFSPDGRFLALSCDSDVGIFVVDCVNWEVIDTLRGHERSAVRLLAYSPDGRYLASGSWDTTRDVTLWEAPSQS